MEITAESWLFLFIRCDLVIDVLDEPAEVTLTGAGADEVSGPGTSDTAH